MQMLALVIALPILLVVIPGFVLILGLCRAAARVAPGPGDASLSPAAICSPPATRRSAFARHAELIRQQLARADYN